MAEHTPGPWKPLWDNSTGEVFIAPVDADSNIVGDCVATLDELNISQAELGANARLIAAAPDLLCAAQTLIAAYGFPNNPDFPEAELPQWLALLDAIAKAQGRKP